MKSSVYELIQQLDEEQTPGHLDQVEMFYEDTDEVFKSLTGVITKSEEAVSYGTVRQEQAPELKEDETLGYVIVHPNQHAGLSCVLHCDPKKMKNSVKAVFPFIDEGCKYPCTIQSVKLFDNKVEAQIEAFIDDEQNLSMTFYDAHYLNNRAFYNGKDTFHFIIRGFAYCIEINQPGKVQITDPEELQKLAGVVEGEVKEKVELDLENMIAVYPREDMGADHYEIQSPVLEVNQYPEKVNEQTVWQIRVMLGRNPDGSEIPLDVYITERSLEGAPLPKVGDNISAVVWLQGHLWGIGDEENPEE